MIRFLNHPSYSMEVCKLNRLMGKLFIFELIYPPIFIPSLLIPFGSRQIRLAVCWIGLGSRQHFWMPGQFVSNQQPVEPSWRREMPTGWGQFPGCQLIQFLRKNCPPYLRIDMGHWNALKCLLATLRGIGLSAQLPTARAILRFRRALHQMGMTLRGNYLRMKMYGKRY